MKKSLLLAAAFLAGFSASASAATIQAPGALWEYTFTEPASPTWTTTLGEWNTGPAPFGNSTDPDFGYQNGTFWEAGLNLFGPSFVWVRKELDLTGWDLSTIQYDLSVDNSFMLFINGDYAGGDGADGFTYRWEYTGSLPEEFLEPGVNILALRLTDYGGSTAFDMQIRGELNSETAVPEPATWLGALGLAALACRRRRKS